jgi:RsiW-degrading membrane proteinase PrsW (M82 family)
VLPGGAALNTAFLTHGTIALAPVVLFLAGLRELDAYKLLRARMLFALMAAGAVAGIASYFANTLAYAHYGGDFTGYSRHVSPWIEEALKAVLLVFLVRTRRVGVPVDAGIAGFAIGTGFALVENLYYLATRPDAALAVEIIRGFGTAIMHGGTMTIMAMISVTLFDRRPQGGPFLLLPGYLAAVALHSAFNYLLAQPMLATLAMLLVLPLAIYAIFQRSERALRDWLDSGLDSDVQLLESINSGAFLDTHSGRYLQELRERFRGEDLADMLCLLRLHGELALRAKGVLLMRESGLDEPPPDEETREKLAELGALKRSIGRVGVLALRPLLMTSGKDVWELTLLAR